MTLIDVWEQQDRDPLIPEDQPYQSELFFKKTIPAYQLDSDDEEQFKRITEENRRETWNTRDETEEILDFPGNKTVREEVDWQNERNEDGVLKGMRRIAKYNMEEWEENIAELTIGSIDLSVIGYDELNELEGIDDIIP
jgi:hypothetical protein